MTHPTPQLVSTKRLWGRGVRETTRFLHKAYGHGTEVACIGQAGEKLVRFATIMTSVYSAAARGGIGAVMGAKRLKAIVVDPGQGSVGVAQPRSLADAVRTAREKLYADSIADELHPFGTARDVDLLNALRLLPAFNFRNSHVPG